MEFNAQVLSAPSAVTSRLDALQGIESIIAHLCSKAEMMIEKIEAPFRADELDKRISSMELLLLFWQL